MGKKYERYDKGVLVESYDTRTDEEKAEDADSTVIAARNKERGSLQEQWEYFIDNGYTKLKKRDDDIKLNHPKRS